RPGRADDHLNVEHYPVVGSKVSRLRQNHRIADHYDQPSPERGHSSSKFTAFEPRAGQSKFHSMGIYGNISCNSRRIGSASIQTPTPDRTHGIRIEDPNDLNEDLPNPTVFSPLLPLRTSPTSARLLNSPPPQKET